MTAINFPDSPALNDEFTAAGRTWTWDGTAWTSVPGTISLTDVDVTATASELNVLDGITATTTELNHVDGVTSAIQAQLNSKAVYPNQTQARGSTLLSTGTDAVWTPNTFTNSPTDGSPFGSFALGGSIFRWEYVGASVPANNTYTYNWGAITSSSPAPSAFVFGGPFQIISANFFSIQVQNLSNSPAFITKILAVYPFT